MYTVSHDENDYAPNQVQAKGIRSPDIIFEGIDQIIEELGQCEQVENEYTSSEITRNILDRLKKQLNSLFGMMNKIEKGL